MSALAFYLSGFFPVLWDGFLAPYQLVDGTSLGTLPGALVGMLFLELVNYGWHRALHRSELLWRWSHQMHHSAERIDVPSALYFSPLDMAGWAAMASLALTLILGLTVEAVILANFGLLFLNVLQHANIRTPPGGSGSSWCGRKCTSSTTSAASTTETCHAPHLGSGLWHVREPQGGACRVRLLRRRLGAHPGDAPRPRREPTPGTS